MFLRVFLAAVFSLLCWLNIAAQTDPATMLPTVDSVLSGAWSGDVTTVSGLRNRVIIHISAYVNGPCDATWDNPNSGYFGNQFSSVSCSDGKLLFTSVNDDLVFEGQASAQPPTITGVWKQRKTNSPVVLKKIIIQERTQEPGQAPPYITSEIRFPNRPAGIMLAGELTFPDTLGRYPLVILAGDRGQTDRNARGSSGHAPYLVLASLFAQKNIATLRIDDRGVGQSTGTGDITSIDDEASDMSAALERIRTHPHIDTSRIVIIGHGEGGLAAAVVANRYPDRVSRVVFMSTPAMDGRNTLLTQIAARERLRETDEELISVATGMVDQWCTTVLLGGVDSVVVPRILELADSIIDERPDLLVRYPMAAQFKRAGREAYITSSLLPWLRSYLWYQPSEYFSAMRQPLLALYAERDTEIPGEEHAAALRKTSSQRTRTVIEVIKDVNHMFQTCDECTDEEMSRLGETVNPEVVKRIVKWILQGS
ncbi:MAG: alpha/beta hydrolase [Ignavibacteria bacterium]|nr:alpha/beta hydrolase [Ignavibacteria bacterium]MBK7411185.1 alpha/beta hydrolase [Ignavibacteria bacterium]MBK7578057.1 alpha/beta hydrolase [Ignavibacteria bacterium]